MRLQCPTCASVYNIDDTKIPDHDVTFKCKRCQSVITVHGKLSGDGESSNLMVCSKCGNKQVQSIKCDRCGLITRVVIEKLHTIRKKYNSITKCPQGTNWLDYGYSLMKRKEYGRATVVLTIAIDKNVAKPESLFLRSQSLLHLGFYLQAIHDLILASDLGNSDALLLLNTIKYGWDYHETVNKSNNHIIIDREEQEEKERKKLREAKSYMEAFHIEEKKLGRFLTHLERQQIMKIWNKQNKLKQEREKELESLERQKNVRNEIHELLIKWNFREGEDGFKLLEEIISKLRNMGEGRGQLHLEVYHKELMFFSTRSKTRKHF